jgi:hypothetical protein
MSYAAKFALIGAMFAVGCRAVGEQPIMDESPTVLIGDVLVDKLIVPAGTVMQVEAAQIHASKFITVEGRLEVCGRPGESSTIKLIAGGFIYVGKAGVIVSADGQDATEPLQAGGAGTSLLLFAPLTHCEGRIEAGRGGHGGLAGTGGAGGSILFHGEYTTSAEASATSCAVGGAGGRGRHGSREVGHGAGAIGGPGGSVGAALNPVELDGGQCARLVALCPRATASWGAAEDEELSSLLSSLR